MFEASQRRQCLTGIVAVICVAVDVTNAFTAPSTTSSILTRRAPLDPQTKIWLIRLDAAANSEREVDPTSTSEKGSPVEEYRNIATKVLSNFMRKEEAADMADPLASIDFGAPKTAKLSLATLASLLDAELYESEWFVTGNVNPSYFADAFKFQDPDVKVSGIEDYARGVNKLFDQKTARAEIISTAVNSDVPNTITCKWRLSGNVSIGPGLTIKPYIVYTDFTVDPDTGLIVFQQDRFDAPQWDILLSSLFPWTIGRITAPPAPPVEPRNVKRPLILSAPVSPKNPLDAFTQSFNKLFS